MEGDVLGMSTMIFADEVVDRRPHRRAAPSDEVEIKSRRSRSRSSWSTRSPPTSSRPSTRTPTASEVLALIERKAAGEEIAVQPATEEEAAPVPDLMAALKASLDAVQKDGKKKPPQEARRQEGAGEEEGRGQGLSGKRSSRNPSTAQRIASRRLTPPRSVNTPGIDFGYRRRHASTIRSSGSAGFRDNR